MFNAKYLLPLALLSASSLAEEAKPFTAEAEFGAILTSGNTESTAASGKLNIKQELTSWRTNYILGALYKKDESSLTVGGVTTTDDQVTAEKYYLSAQGDYKLNEEHRGLFIYGSYDDDRFSGYDYQATIAAGYSDRFFKNDTTTLDYSVGPGYSFWETEDGDSDSAAIIRASLAFEHNFSENAKFTQTLASDIAVDSDKNTRTRAESALTSKINDDFALKASYTVTHNSEAPEDKEATDAVTALTLVYSF